MADAALKPMTLGEFLRWEDGTETQYELIDGFPVAMAPPLQGHRILAMRLGSRTDQALSARRPCNAQIEAGILRADQGDTFFVADIAASCAPIDPRHQWMPEPFLIVEILSASTERHDRRLKLPAYRQIESVQEVLLIASDSMHAELHRRSGAQWMVEIIRGPDAILTLASVPIEVRLSELYDGIVLPDEEE
jgi:Uma2 family endonuclease